MSNDIALVYHHLQYGHPQSHNMEKIYFRLSTSHYILVIKSPHLKTKQEY